MKGWLICCIFLLTILAGVWFWQDHHASRKVMSALHLQRKDIVASVVQKGRLHSVSEPILYAKASGEIASIQSKEGDWVKKGITLLDMAPGDLKFQIDESKADLKNSQIMMQKAQDNLSMKLFLGSGGGVAPAELVSARRELEAAEAQYSKSKATLELCLQHLSDLKIASPQTGQVSSIWVAKGDIVSSGTPLLQIIDPTHLKVELYVGEMDIPAIKIGDKAKVAVLSLQNLDVRGAISAIQPVLEKKGDSYSAKVTVLIDNEGRNGLRPGQQVEVRLITGIAKDVFTLPLNSVSYENGHSIVQVETNKGIQKKIVELGLQNETDVEVKAGITPMESVVLP